MTTRKTESRLSVAIIGGGIGGAAAAVALQHAGIHAEIYEQATVLREVGAAVGIQPPSVRLFQQWGIADQFEQVAVRAHWVEMFEAADGKSFRKMAMPVRSDDPGDNWAATVHRADLHSLLLAQVPPESIHLGRKAQTVIEQEDHAEIRFVDSSSVRASLVIGADGIHSVVRPLISSDTPIYAGLRAHLGTVLRENTFGLLQDDVLPSWVAANGAAMLLLPMRAGKLVCVDVVLPTPNSIEESWSITTRADDVAEKMEGFQPVLVQVVRNAEGPLNNRALFDRAPIDHWSRNSITLLGDAAHPMLPTQGQGANMAIEDAAVLAEILRGVESTGIPEALQRYEARRKPIVTLFQEKSHQVTTTGIRDYDLFTYEQNPSELSRGTQGEQA